MYDIHISPNTIKTLQVWILDWVTEIHSTFEMASASGVMKYATGEHSRESLDTEKPLLFLAPELIFKSLMQMYPIFGATFGGTRKNLGLAFNSRWKSPVLQL